LAVIGGLTTSTLMSLIVIPCVFDVFDGLKDRFRSKRKYADDNMDFVEEV
jgi:Cu/Ag efflux pump CusA